MELTAGGLRILDGTKVRLKYFRRSAGRVFLDLDGRLHPFNIDKESFWSKTCGELIGRELRSWLMTHDLRSGQHLEMEVVQDGKIFRPLVPKSN